MSLALRHPGDWAVTGRRCCPSSGLSRVCVPKAQTFSQVSLTKAQTLMGFSSSALNTSSFGTAAAARFSMQPEKLAQDKGIDEMLFKRKAQSVASQMWEDTG